MGLWALLDPAVIDDAVIDYNNARIPKGLWRCPSDAHTFIADTVSRVIMSRKARVVRSFSCLRKISYRTTVIQQALLLRRVYESCGQTGFTLGGTEIAFKCSLLSMLAMVDNSELAMVDNSMLLMLAMDDDNDLPDARRSTCHRTH